MTEDNFMDWNSAFKMMKTSKEEITLFASLTFSQFFDKEFCSLKAVWKSPQKSPLAYAFPKRSPLTPFFNHVLLKLKESGAIEMLKKKWEYPYNLDCSVQNSDEFERVSAKKVVLILVIFGSSVILSLICVVIENILVLK